MPLNRRIQARGYNPFPLAPFLASLESDALRATLDDYRRIDEYAKLDDDFVKLAVSRFLALRDRDLRKKPSTGELLVWLRVLALAVGTYPENLDKDLSKLPYLGVLLKDHQDIEDLG